MLTSEQIAEIRMIDYKFLGRFLGLADLVGHVSDKQIIQSLTDIKAEYVKQAEA